MTPAAAQLAEWLVEHGLAKYIELFGENAVGLDVLAQLTEEDLKGLGIPFGDRKRILVAAKTLAPGISLNEASSSACASSLEAQAERRQLTVMFCDLAGSTALSERLDPEELREIMHAYRQTCAAVVARYDGHVAQYLGDGIMAYFGWPRAHEDEAERAVRAALEIVQAVKRVSSAEALHVRLGIATGPVVVGDASERGDNQLAVGGTPNLASRLQGLAGLDEIIISPSTHRLIGGAFELVDLGLHVLKGIAEPLRAWKVDALSKTEGRFEAAHSGAVLTPLVGREEEMALLLRRWAQATEGEGQVVLIGGEAGIGKSRVSRALRDQIAGRSHLMLRYQCSPFHQNSALYPIIEQIEYAAAFTREDSPKQRLDKMETMLAGTPDELARVAPLFAALLSLPLDRYPPLNLSPARQKEKTLEALAGQVEALARRQPVLMLYEDVHWMDASSQEALDLLVPRLQSLPVLLFVTHRLGYNPRWQGQAHVSSLGLNRLGRRQAVALVEGVTGGKTLPPEVLEQIVAKTDGVPLFAEELTKTVLESGLLTDKGDHFELSGPLPALALPSTLRDSLIARLDRLASVKDIAQIGACIGREFVYGLLRRLTATNDEALEQALEQLVDAGLIFRKGTPPDAVYTFKHALVQDAAYDSLLKSRRQQIHARIAQVLESEFPDQTATKPEILAHHLTQADRNGRAVPYWFQAGQLAMSGVALAEAINHLTTALSVNSRLPASADRDRQELEIRVLLARAYQAFLGFAAVQVVQVLKPALELAVRLGETAKLAPVHALLWLHHEMRCEYPAALKIIDQLDALARSREDPTLSLVARYLETHTRVVMGEFRRSEHNRGQVFSAYDPAKHALVGLIGNIDIKCDVLVWAGCCLFARGYPDQARRAVEEGVERARSLGNAFNLCWSLCGGSRYTLLLLGDTGLALQWVADARAVALEHGMAFVADVVVRGSRGYALIEQGEYEHGYAELTISIESLMKTGGLQLVPYAYVMRARALTGLARYDEARSLLQDAIELTNQTGHRIFEAETHRALGELNQQQAPHDVHGAEAAFLKAIEVAQSQEAKGFELRAATSLAQLWESQGKRREAYDLLAPLYNWFTEGFAAKDLKEAKALLDELS